MKPHNTFILYWNPEISNFKDHYSSGHIKISIKRSIKWYNDQPVNDRI